MYSLVLPFKDGVICVVIAAVVLFVLVFDIGTLLVVVGVAVTNSIACPK